ncbi:hypothetical protein PPERSA_07189 [Pseudocohnilembus persalinus]|uniref:Xylulose kinase n=1 Tax=Pseudocohnilembus persalinus TaxID=266149 RepID=A0A0V0QXR8_PSEPJ|nr:hypothetical protein PPERSA_07189 [Pseudocohnilembus persalinus]|eukprot:KRX07026.1 hypothetical protein PPERSA_07189 [Pseudocohnilembus persalinus]
MSENTDYKSLIQKLLKIQKPGQKYAMSIEISTQSLKILITDIFDLSIIYNDQLNFEQNFKKKYDLQPGGININPENTNEITQNAYMFIEAIDTVLEKTQLVLSQKMKKNNQDIINNIICISFCGQQHGQIYYRHNFQKILQNLDSKYSLLDHFQDNYAFSVDQCPIWMDCSTTEQCKQLEKQIGKKKLIEKTGSKAYERFSGNQIAKIIQNRPNIYESTENISLISSFLGEIFTGNYAPIDLSDASGMNLLNLHSLQYDDEILEKIVNLQNQCNGKDDIMLKKEDLLNKLGPGLIQSDLFLGKISNYMQNRFGFNQECMVFQGAGDNPSSLIGLGLFEEGKIAISLGSSDTVIGPINYKNIKPQEKGHIMVHPGLNLHGQIQYFFMICTKNGGIVREMYKNKLQNATWENFNKILEEKLEDVSFNNNQKLGIFFKYPEIIPEVKVENLEALIDFENYNEIENIDDYIKKNLKEINYNEKETLKDQNIIRYLVEGKIMSLKINSQSFGINNFKQVIVTGGASQNPQILQIIADVFQADVYCLKNEFIQQNSALFGGALRAIQGIIKLKSKQANLYEKIKEKVQFVYLFQNFFKENQVLKNKPNLEKSKWFRKMEDKYQKLEKYLEQKYIY